MHMPEHEILVLIAALSSEGSGESAHRCRVTRGYAAPEQNILYDLLVTVKAAPHDWSTSDIHVGKS